MLGALGNRELAASLVSSTLPPGTTRGAKGPSLTLSAGAFEGSLSMSLILSPWRGGGSLPSSLLGGGWVVVEGAVGSNNLNRDGVGDGEGNGDGGDSRRGTNHAAAGTRDGEDIDDRRGEVWRKVLAAGLVLRGGRTVAVPCRAGTVRGATGHRGAEGRRWHVGIQSPWTAVVVRWTPRGGRGRLRVELWRGMHAGDWSAVGAARGLGVLGWAERPRPRWKAARSLGGSAVGWLVEEYRRGTVQPAEPLPLDATSVEGRGQTPGNVRWPEPPLLQVNLSRGLGHPLPTPEADRLAATK